MVNKAVEYNIYYVIVISIPALYCRTCRIHLTHFMLMWSKLNVVFIV